MLINRMKHHLPRTAALVALAGMSSVAMAATLLVFEAARPTA